MSKNQDSMTMRSGAID